MNKKRNFIECIPRSVDISHHAKINIETNAAECDCGWQGPERDFPFQAKEDIYKHNKTDSKIKQARRMHISPDDNWERGY